MTMDARYFNEEIIPKLKEIDEEFVFVSGGPEICLRSSINCEDKVNSFLKKFQNITNTEYITFNKTPNPTRVAFHKAWKCQHSSYRKKKLQSKKNTYCDASVKITIKKITKTTLMRDKFLTQNPPLPCIINIQMEHNHHTDNASSLGMLRVQEETKMQFFQYFALGMGPTESKHFHESFILEEPEGHLKIANASLNPTLRQVSYLHDVWRNENLGSMSNPLEKIKEKMTLYEERGVKIILREETPWVVLIVTPVMSRIHYLDSCKEMIFLDSTGSVECSKSIATLLLTATQAGALPLCFMIHENQTKENYSIAFELFKQHFPNCFGGKEEPMLFMTDDSSAEKGALSEIWPASTQLLCHFHVAQAEWRWLNGKIKNITLEERKRLMKLFQNVMYADSIEKLNAAVSILCSERTNYPLYVDRFQSFFQRRKEWLLFDRLHLLTRGHNTNNYSEASIRILKDVVLNREKAFNVTALVEFCITGWEEDLITKLLDVAYGRKKTSLSINVLSSSLKKFDDRHIIKIDDENYIVPSASSSETYVVDVSVGVCSCKNGMSGRFCKHQAFLFKHIPCNQNAPIVTEQQRRDIAYVALGDKCPKMHFFTELQTIDVCSSDVQLDVQNISATEHASCESIVAPSSSAVELASSLTVEVLKEKMSNLIPENIPKSLALSLDQSLSKLLPQERLKVIRSFSNLLKTRGKRMRKINVQPMSISRRRSGSSKGHRRIAPGRPHKKWQKK